jgi:hypothetical protein
MTVNPPEYSRRAHRHLFHPPDKNNPTLSCFWNFRPLQVGFFKRNPKALNLPTFKSNGSAGQKAFVPHFGTSHAQLKPRGCGGQLDLVHARPKQI